MSYNYNPYLPQYQSQQHLIYKMLPVSSIEEINSTPVDFNGAPTYFHNQPTDEIYIKQFDVRTGLSNLQVYNRKINESKPKNENPLEKDLNVIKQRLDTLEKALSNNEEPEEKPKRK